MPRPRGAAQPSGLAHIHIRAGGHRRTAHRDPALFDTTLDRARGAVPRPGETRWPRRSRPKRPARSRSTCPDGGLFLWPRLRDDSIDAERLAADASDEGVEYQRGLRSSRRARHGRGSPHPSRLRRHVRGGSSSKPPGGSAARCAGRAPESRRGAGPAPRGAPSRRAPSRRGRSGGVRTNEKSCGGAG